MNNREPSWWHMLWIIPSVIVTEALMLLGIMKHDKGGNHGRRRKIIQRPVDGGLSMSVLHWIIAEFRALGWRCIAYGPEFWLAAAVICWVIAVGIAAIFVIIWRDKK